MSVISFGPNQQLNQQQRTAYQTSQKVKQAAWETSHRMAALNNTPADNPTNGDNVEISTPTPLPKAAQGSVAVFDANVTGSVNRGENGQLQKAEVHAQLADGRQWDVSFQHEGDMLSYSAPSPSGQGQVHVMENLKNGTIAFLESPQLVPDYAEQLKSHATSAPVEAPAAPPSAPGWGAPQETTSGGLFGQAGGFFKKMMGGSEEKPQAEQPQAPQKSFSEYASEGKAKAVEVVKSDTGRKWGKLLIGSAGMGFLDKALGDNKEEAPPQS